MRPCLTGFPQRFASLTKWRVTSLFSRLAGSEEWGVRHVKQLWFSFPVKSRHNWLFWQIRSAEADRSPRYTKLKHVHVNRLIRSFLHVAFYGLFFMEIVLPGKQFINIWKFKYYKKNAGVHIIKKKKDCRHLRTKKWGEKLWISSRICHYIACLCRSFGWCSQMQRYE